MSRTRKKTKVKGITTAESEKENKQEANRKLRRNTKKQIKKNPNILPELREVSDKQGFNKDGKIYDPDMKEKDLPK
jgi:hypothetical protein